MRILITGGAGFVGTSLCLRLKQNYPSYTVLAFDNLKRRGSELNLTELKKYNIEFIHGDIRNKEDLEAVGGFDVLVEASAEPSVLAGLGSDPTYVINNNFNGSINCFNQCLKHNAKLIFLSTSRVYPIDRIENANFVEQDTRFSFAPKQDEVGISINGISEELNLSGARSFYGATKLASEFFIEEYAAFYGIEAAVTRFGVIAGPRQMGKTDQGVVTLWMANHFWSQSLKYIGYGGLGKQVRDILHIEDLISLVDIQIHNIQQFKNKVFNAGGGLENSISLQEMTRVCEDITGNKIVIHQDNNNRPADLRVYITDNTKISSAVGWSPQKTLQDVFTDVFEWMKADEKKLKNIFL